MKLLIYCDDPGQGGTAVNAALLARGLTGPEIETLLASGYGQDLPDVPGVRRVPLGQDLAMMPLKAWLSRHEPEALLLAQRPDCVLFCDASPESSLAAKAVCMAWGVPFLVLANHVPASVADQAEDVRKRLVEANAAALAVVAVSQDNLQLLREHCGVPTARSGVIYNGRPAEFFEPVGEERRAAFRHALGLEPEDVFCLTVARYEPRKGYRYLLAAVQTLAQQPEGQALHFAWIGHDVVGSGVVLAEEVMALGLASRVLVMGECNNVRDWMAAADIFVLSSESEGMPLCIIEAMGQGLPVVATGVSGVPELLGETGVLLPDPRTDPVGVIDALVRVLPQLVRSPDHRRKLGAAGRQRAVTRFTEQSMLAGYHELLESLRPTIAASRPRYPDPAFFVPSNAIRFGKVVFLGDDAQAMEYLDTGWSHGEGNGRWTEGHRASLVLRLPKTASWGCVLEITVKPFLPAPKMGLAVRIVFCDQRLGQWIWPPLPNEELRLELAFFPHVPLPAEAKLVFEIRGASSPLDHGLSDDTRKLGLWVKSVRLRELRPFMEMSWPA